MASKKGKSKSTATTKKKSAESKPKPAPASKPAATDAEVVTALIKIQKRKLTNSEFSAVSLTIALLTKE